MATLEIPNRYLALNPVLVTSPTARCGTTLVQRLLCASNNAFLYGEEVAHHMRTLTTWLFGVISQMETNGDQIDADYARALAGALSDWRPGLYPPTAVVLKGWIETYYQIPAALAAQGEAVGRPVWGAKAPAYPRDTLKAFLTLMPRMRIVYVFRDLNAVVASAKARRFVATPAEVETLCADWARNLTEVSAISGDERILFVKYEDMVARREEYVRLLELFTGAEGIDPATFDLKLNTFAGDPANGHAPDQYIAPAPLTADDRAAVRTHAGPILERLYGEAA